jgi:hypothetical protein
VEDSILTFSISVDYASDQNRARGAPIAVVVAGPRPDGSLSGVMEACCLQPIDVVKMRLQLDRVGHTAASRTAVPRSPVSKACTL